MPMRWVYLTAGAAGMYCGSCMHDNTLARGLAQLDIDCLLVPLYTPIRTDEQDSSLDRLFFGGINVYLQQRWPGLAYLPAWLDGLLNRPRLVRWLAAGNLQTSPSFLGSLTVSMLRGTEGNQRKEVRRLCRWLQRDIQPDLVLLTNMLIAGCVPELKRRLDIPVLVTLQGDDIFYNHLPEPYRQQALAAMRNLVPSIDGFVVHSQAYADKMAQDLSIPHHRFLITPLGIDVSSVFTPPPPPTEAAPPPEPSPAAAAQRRVTLGFLARLAPEKGLDVLVEAFILAAQQPWGESLQLAIAGWQGPQHLPFRAALEQRIADAQLSDRYRCYPDPDQAGKRRFLSSIDLLCVPTSYHDPKGLFVLEAVAAGVPYLQPAHGAFPELHQRLDAGQLFSPNTPQALTDALQQLLPRLTEMQQTNRRRLPELHQEIGLSRMATRTVHAVSEHLSKPSPA
jgi:glycosyltransferase involved in cell wall biosynthesis